MAHQHAGPWPEEFRIAAGNRIYGCDDCQLACPWNKFAQRAELPDFDVRPALSSPDLLTLWAWDEAQFLRLTEGSPIRRIGFAKWQRNLAVAMGNALRVPGPHHEAIRQALQAWPSGASWADEARAAERALVAEHVAWALAQSAPA